MEQNKLVIGIIGLTVAIIVGGVFLVTKLTNQTQLTANQEARAEVTETNHDWGEIPINGGNVTKTFEIKNLGSGGLQLANISTSCMCTTAQVSIDNKKSPFFGMHSKSTWIGEIPAGGTAQLIVEFDPAYHGPNGLGINTREVTLETNDLSQSQIVFTLTANVIKGG